MRMPVTLNIYAIPGIYRNKYRTWGRQDADTWLTHFLSDVREYGIRIVELFPYSHDSDAIYPWRPYDKDWNPDPVWWKQQRHMQRCFKAAKMQPQYILWSKYQWRMYNDAGMHEKSEAAWRYFERYARRLGRVQRRKWPLAPRTVRYSNEIGHYGNHASGNEWALWHERLHDTVGHLWKRGNSRFDVSHSDFMKLEGPHIRYHKCYHYETGLISEEDWDKMSPEWQSHRPILGTWGRDEFSDRDIWIEWHGASAKKMLGPIEPGADKNYISVMHQGSWDKFVWNLDGTGDFEGGQVPGTPFTKPTYAEIRSWARLGFAQQHGSVKISLGYFPMEIFKRNADGKLVEDLSLMDFEYLDIIKEEWERWLRLWVK